MPACTCGPATRQPSAVELANRCMSSRRSPSVSPIRMPVDPINATMKRSRALRVNGSNCANCSRLSHS